ncbi:response regulator [Enterovirga sp. CN4-39]|uniref:response regulator n=1 Tax=Enterovirga sp. CN4-39 TaxID=3400910 RepID=UPI003C06E3F1
MPSKHVVVVDDDAVMRDLIGDYLVRHAFKVSRAADGAAMARVVTHLPPDLIILDLQLGTDDGLELMRSMSTKVEAPVIIITGNRGEEADKVVGLELGADDYITKPFSLRELLARVRAVLRRAEGAGAAARRKSDRSTYRFGGWELSMKARRLTSPQGEVIRLTAAEFNLLSAFLRSPQHVLSREQLLNASRVHDDEVYDRSIDVLILRLRRKLERDPRQPTLIRTERGMGYVLSTRVEVG